MININKQNCLIELTIFHICSVSYTPILKSYTPASQI
jgi:hypothetical protein